MNLEQLTHLIEIFRIQDISCDSRTLSTNSAFFAIKGHSYDGNNFINQALNQGAQLIFTDDIDTAVTWQKSKPNQIVLVENARLSFALAAEILYPKLPRYLIAVTGTNGKSSTVYYCQQLAFLLNQPSACIGTMGIISSNPKYHDTKENSLTTHDIKSLRQLLHNMTEDNMQFISFEASSHGIAQKRLYNIKANAAAFTSFSQDHLDYHNSMTEYLQAKLLLFKDNLKPQAPAIIAEDVYCIPEVQKYLQQHQVNYIVVGKNVDITQTNTIKINIFNHESDQVEICLTYLQQSYNFTTNIIAGFQINNLVIALALVYFCVINNNIDNDLELLNNDLEDQARVTTKDAILQKIISLTPNILPLEGRMEKIEYYKIGAHIFIDYAHTPDALIKALQALLSIKKSTARLILVFGCGGDRDKEKRPLMGKIAGELADIIIITDDNPRFEDPETIRQEIYRGVIKANIKLERKITIIGDRFEAIKHAVKLLRKDDILLVAGKGAEQYQIIREQKILFSDKKSILSIINFA